MFIHFAHDTRQIITGNRAPEHLMTIPAAPADSGQSCLSPSRTPAVVGRRAVLSGVLGLSAGALLRPSTAAAARHPVVTNIFSYGHSYTMLPSPYVTRPFYDEYQLQLGRRLGSKQVISRGRSGTFFLDTISAIIAPTFAGSTERKWRIGDRGIVLLENMMNDVSFSGGGNPDYLNAYEKAMRLALGVFGASSFTHADGASRVGDWQVKVSPRLEDGRGWYSEKYDDHISFEVRGDSVHVSTQCTDPKLFSQGTLRAECNGKVLGYFGRDQDNGTYACNRGTSYTDSLDHVTQSWTPAGWRISGLNTAARTRATKTLTLRKIDNTTATVWVQGVYLASRTSPRVFVAKEPPRNPGATSQRHVAAFYRNEPAYRALIDKVCNEYRAAYSVDLRPGWDNATMVSELDTVHRFHPNTLGMSSIATSFERAINKAVRDGGPGRH
jgi:hypothetical protein